MCSWGNMAKPVSGSHEDHGEPVAYDGGVDRRSIILDALPLSLALFLAPKASFAAVRDRTVAAAVYDRRVSGAEALTVQLAGGGVPRFSVEDDVTALWDRHLRGFWTSGSGHVVGVTTRGALFCLEQLAAIQGRRIVSRKSVRKIAFAQSERLVAWSIGRGDSRWVQP